ncbi:GNAT family N-acetyltransferase [Salinadaptatus halalkaliphilus]|uniref:GNAT family N-acetyltransferase n=1 Tax=Salinadaptatus halalkaliphilus TaxID=2419781 RepID=UPI001580EA46|nr:GNAT family N-acetyltransferase [Salinadaptatus halalkaliphilus]
MITVRTATLEDAPAIARIHTVSLHHYGGACYEDEQVARLAPTDVGPEEIRENLFGPDRYVAVADVDDDIVGFGGVRRNTGSLLGIFVDPSHGGNGIGTRVLEGVESHARDRGLERLSVFAALNAVAFYEACGFERVGERDANGADGPFGTYDGGDHDLPVMEMRKPLE